jgi:hypothetical protein
MLMLPLNDFCRMPFLPIRIGLKFTLLVTPVPILLLTAFTAESLPMARRLEFISAISTVDRNEIFISMLVIMMFLALDSAKRLTQAFRLKKDFAGRTGQKPMDSTQRTIVVPLKLKLSQGLP